MKSTVFSSTILLLAFGTAAEAAASFDPTVTCDPEIPDICRGSLEHYTPSPAMIDHGNGTLETIYMGGWRWSYNFVRGLPDGYADPYNGYPSSYGIYDYGPNVVITLDDDLVTCGVTVGNETCSTCSVCGTSSSVSSSTLTADCTNLQTQNFVPDTGAGKMMDCVPTLPFFYPLEIPTDLPDLPPPTSSPSMMP